MDTTVLYGLLILGWVIYFAVHSFLAALKVKRALTNVFGLSLKIQRLIYTLISVIGLLALLFLNGAIPSDSLLPSHREVKVFSLFLAAGGFFIVKASFKSYNIRSFLGIKEEDNSKLNRSGINAHMRHPLYTGTILIIVGFFFYDPRMPSLVTTCCVLLYLPIGIYLEENKLIREFGEKYVTYKREVPGLIPWKIIKKS